MLLARYGHRVLLVDRAAFPSDVISTHLLHVPAVADLHRWGLLDRVAASGCPPHRSFTMDFGEFAITGPPPPVDGIATPYCVRRTVLDTILAEAAVEAGAEVRHRFTVDELVREDGVVTGVRGRGHDGRSLVERARLVVGADGLHSMVARQVGAARYAETPALTAGYYTYYPNVSADGAQIYSRGDRSVVVFPTNDGLACVFVACPAAQFHAFRADIEGSYLAAIERVPQLAAQVRASRPAERIRGTADLPNFFRQAHGPGWALVGDAGYHKDPCLASGITDAFTSARLLADAVHAGLTGVQPMDRALAGYAARRDARFLPYLQLTCQLATMEPLAPPTAALFRSIAASPAECTRFFGALQGSTPLDAYFAPDNIGRIMATGDRGR